MMLYNLGKKYNIYVSPLETIQDLEKDIKYSLTLIELWKELNPGLTEAEHERVKRLRAVINEFKELQK